MLLNNSNFYRKENKNLGFQKLRQQTVEIDGGRNFELYFLVDIEGNMIGKPYPVKWYLYSVWS